MNLAHCNVSVKGPIHKPTNHADQRQRQQKKISVTVLIGWPTNVVCLSIELWSPLC